MNGLDKFYKQTLTLSRRVQVQRMVKAIQALPKEQQMVSDDCPVKHHFAPGQYAREIFLPAGSLVVGKIHKHAHVNIISKGLVEVYTEGEGLLTLAAPLTFVSTPGSQRVVRVLEDTVWTTVHSTNKTDLSEIEQEVIAKDHTEV